MFPFVRYLSNIPSANPKGGQAVRSPGPRAPANYEVALQHKENLIFLFHANCVHFYIFKKLVFSRITTHKSY